MGRLSLISYCIRLTTMLTSIFVYCCFSGLCLAIGSLSSDMDKFWCFSPDAFPFKTNLKESQVLNSNLDLKSVSVILMF